MGWWYVCRRAKCILAHQDKCIDKKMWLYFQDYMSSAYFVWWPIARCSLCKKLSWTPFEVYQFGVEFKEEE